MNTTAMEVVSSLNTTINASDRATDHPATHGTGGVPSQENPTLSRRPEDTPTPSSRTTNLSQTTTHSLSNGAPKAPPGHGTARTASSASPEEKAKAQLQRAIESTRAQVAAAGFEVGVELLTDIAKLPPSEKSKRISELSRLNAYELERENNIAKNNVLLRQLGLDHAAAQLVEQHRRTSNGGLAPAGDEDDYAPSATAAKKGKHKQPGDIRRSHRHKKAPETHNTGSEDEGGSPEGREEGEGAEAHGTEREGEDHDTGGGEGQGTENDTMEDGKECNGEQGGQAADSQENDTTDVVGENDAMDDSEERNRKQGAQAMDSGENEDIEAPKWFTEAAKAFDGADSEVYGQAWFDLIKDWRQWEAWHGYESEVRQHPLN